MPMGETSLVMQKDFFFQDLPNLMPGDLPVVPQRHLLPSVQQPSTIRDHSTTVQDYIFGYGSIINNSSRLTTLQGSSPRNKDEVVFARISSKFGFKRYWCYRSSTGFTALGLRSRQPRNEDENSKADDSICGVLFSVDSPDALAAFDLRETGYFRVAVPHDVIMIDTTLGDESTRSLALYLQDHLFSQRIWIYLPEPGWTASPDEDFPILQTYVDICVRGCLEWGGNELALEFLNTTFGWSEFFLNDAPMSRRPWLHRPNYGAIDTCLEILGTHVKFAERKHPEEFASRHLTTLHGMWNVPQRNSTFVGREEQLAALHEKLFLNQTRLHCASGISQAELIGIGGVGKTQLSIEYCHRHFGSSYGLIAFIRAESPALIAAELRRFALDMGLLVRQGQLGRRTVEGSVDKNCLMTDSSEDIRGASIGDDSVPEIDDDEVVEIIKRKLLRCRYRWLLVFDNVEDPSIIASYLPRGRLLGSLSSVNQSQPSSNTQQSRNSKSGTTDFSPIPILSSVASEDISENGFNVSGVGSTSERDEVGEAKSAMAAKYYGDNHEEAVVVFLSEATEQPEDAGVLGRGSGHVLITSRVSTGKRRVNRLLSSHGGANCPSSRWRSSSAGGENCLPITLSCFDEKESMRFLSLAIHLNENGGKGHDSSSACNVAMTMGGSGGGYYTNGRYNEITASASTMTANSETGISSPDETKSLAILANRMGHLPLALAQASAYIVRCDVSVSEYLRRLDTLIITEGDGDYSIVSSLSVTLNRISRESAAAFDILPLLGYLSPDGITKKLLSLLLLTAHFKVQGPQKLVVASKSVVCATSLPSDDPLRPSTLLCVNDDGLSPVGARGRQKATCDSYHHLPQSSAAVLTAVVAVVSAALTLSVFQRPVTTTRERISVVTLSLLSSLAAGALPQLILYGHAPRDDNRLRTCPRQSLYLRALCYFFDRSNEPPTSFNGQHRHKKSIQECSSITVAEEARANLISEEQLLFETDRVWELLKQFSLLSVRGSRISRVGSIHRLQQAVLRSRCVATGGHAAVALVLEQCVWAVSMLWNFDPVDSRSWESCGSALNHIQTLLEYATVPAAATAEDSVFNGLRPASIRKFSVLLTEAAAYSSVALSRFDVAQTLAEAASFMQVQLEVNPCHGGWQERGDESSDDEETGEEVDLKVKGISVSSNCLSFLAATNTKYARITDVMSSQDPLMLRERADTLHTLGKVLRIRGDYDRSLSSLEQALTLRRVVNCPKEADTLHELGVLNLRRHDYSLALKYLSDSLTLKQQDQSSFGRARSPNNNGTSSACCGAKIETTEAATLHQLAIIATAELRYDEAESLLQRALMLEGGDGSTPTASATATVFSAGNSGSSIVSRAATLQQLGRVALRRGLLTEAESRLSRALQLYARAYGEQKASRHINVAAVRHQLGCCLSAMHRYAEASEQFSIALAARELIYGDNIDATEDAECSNESEIINDDTTSCLSGTPNGHIEIVIELQFLGQAELGRGNLDIAEAHFRRQRAMCERMLKALLSMHPRSDDDDRDEENESNEVVVRRTLEAEEEKNGPEDSEHSDEISSIAALSTTADATNSPEKLFPKRTAVPMLSSSNLSRNYPLALTSTKNNCENILHTAKSLPNSAKLSLPLHHRKIIESVRKSLLFSIYSLRKVAKRRGDMNRAKELTKEAQTLRRLYATAVDTAGHPCCVEPVGAIEGTVTLSVGRVKTSYTSTVPVIAANSTRHTGKSFDHKNADKDTVLPTDPSVEKYEDVLSSTTAKGTEGKEDGDDDMLSYSVVQRQLLSSILGARDIIRLAARKLRAIKLSYAAVVAGAGCPFSLPPSPRTTDENRPSSLLFELRSQLMKKKIEIERIMRSLTPFDDDDDGPHESQGEDRRISFVNNEGVGAIGWLQRVKHEGLVFIQATLDLIHDTVGCYSNDNRSSQGSDGRSAMGISGSSNNSGGGPVAIGGRLQTRDEWMSVSSALFGCCDNVRASLRALGIKIEDA